MMIDLETAGPAPDGAIVSIGWCAFDINAVKKGPQGNGFAYGRINVNVASSVAAGMKLDPSTIGDFWLKQDTLVRNLWNAEDAKRLDVALVMLREEYGSRCERSPKPGLLWAYPATFDLTILDRAYELTGVARPFRAWQDYCCSASVMKGLELRRDESLKKRFPSLMAKHLPEIDAARQAVELQYALNPDGEDPLRYPGDAVAKFD